MKTLVLFGSLLKDNHTRKLLDIALNEIEGEVKLIDAYNSKIVPCIDLCEGSWVRACSN